MTTPTLANLPQEILVEIFKFLPSTDLISLTSTCRAFNHAVNNCNELMKKFTIFIYDNRCELEWRPMRKYTKVFILSDELSNFIHIFEDIGDDLEEIVIKYSKIEQNVIVKIFKLCVNLKFLSLHAVNFNFDGDIEDVPKLKLRKFYFLNIHSNSELIFSLLINSSIEDVEILGEFINPSIFKRFLKAQKNLKKLKIFNQRDTFMLFDDELLSDVEFTLDELKLNNWDMYNQQSPFYRNFIARHQDTLTTFESNNTKIFNFLPHCRILKSVSLPSMHMTNQNVYENVENLEIQVGTIDLFARNFPNVKKLRVYQNYIDFSPALMEIERLEKLEELEINYKKLQELNLPTVKKLTLKFITEFKNRPFNIENLKNIEEIEIVKCGSADWLMDYVRNENFKLKSLVIDETPLSDDCENILRVKIENLKIF